MLKRTILLGVLLALAGAAGAVKEVKTIIHTDHLGSPIMGRSMDGETLWERHYEPYGSQDQAPDDPASPGYTGHLEERDSGLVYAGARWYDPRIGRFMSPDPVRFSVSNPVSFNRYAYANNNPIVYTDPDGRLAVTTLVLIGAGIALISENANTPDVGEKTSNLSVDGLAPAAVLMGGGIIVEAGAVGAAATGTGVRLVTKGAAKEIGVLRAAAKGKGNFGLGSGTRAEAERIGKAWVGKGHKVASDGKTLISKDGLRQYRPPSYKPNLDKTQANFERRFPGQRSNQWQSNGHLNITD